MQRNVNLTQVICLRIGKTTETKPHRVNLRSPFSRIHYYQNKRLQVKRIPVPNTNLQLNSYPNIQLDLQCSDNLAQSMWLTNWCMESSKWLTHQLEKDVGYKVLQFIYTLKIKKLIGHKTLRRTNAATTSRERWTRAYVFGHNMLA